MQEEPADMLMLGVASGMAFLIAAGLWAWHGPFACSLWSAASVWFGYMLHMLRTKNR